MEPNFSAALSKAWGAASILPSTGGNALGVQQSSTLHPDPGMPAKLSFYLAGQALGAGSTPGLGAACPAYLQPQNIT